MADPRGRGGGLVPLSTVATAKPGGAGGGARAPWRRSACRAASLRRHRADAGRGEGRGGVQARRQPAFQLPDDEHPLRLDVRRAGEPHHAEQGHDRHRVRADEPEADGLHEPEDAPGVREADARRPLDRHAGKATRSSWTRWASCRACSMRRSGTATSCTSSSGSRSIPRPTGSRAPTPRRIRSI